MPIVIFHGGISVSKRVVFLTGTRADFGKMKSLILILQGADDYDVHVFATGMHMNSNYGKTVDEIVKSGIFNIYQYINHDTVGAMDRTLAKTIDGFSHYIAEIKPDLIVVHGDRSEALAGAIVGSLNNVLVAHIEGGEVSGAIDELIRHAVTKMAHVHLVANEKAKMRLIQMGELESSIYILGSPDMDLMNPEKLPDIEYVKQYYAIDFERYALAMFHPVTTEYIMIQEYIRDFVDALFDSGMNYVLVFPNNDIGSIEIINEYKRVGAVERFRMFPSIRFEFFLSLLRNSEFIIGNSSSGIMEAPFYGVPTVDIGSRQSNRAALRSIYHCEYNKESILTGIDMALVHDGDKEKAEKHYFGEGQSDIIFLKLMNSGEIWEISHQKQFQELLS